MDLWLSRGKVLLKLKVLVPDNGESLKADSEQTIDGSSMTSK